jgi:putative ABC transport system permease protein
MLTTLRALLQRRRAARELDAELRFHIEAETEANVARGMAPDEARRRALADFGGVVQTHEAVRDVRRFPIESLWQDVRYAVRALGVSPGFTLAAAGMLALAIGISTAMFTVVDSLLLRPVPFPDAGQLARTRMTLDGSGGLLSVKPEVLRAWRQSPAFTGVESAAPPRAAIIEADGAVIARKTALVTPGTFDLLGGVRPILGRLFEPGEGRAGTADRVLLSEDLWRSGFGADPAIVGRRINLDGSPMTVIGVLPASFRYPSWDTALWTPIDFDAPSPEHASEWPVPIVRFAKHMPREDALRVATQAAHEADPRSRRQRVDTLPLVSGRDVYVERAVPLLSGGVVLVFLVLSANVCSLLLARLTARRHEFSLRAALGASRWRLLRQAWAESTVLAGLGTIGGLGVAWLLISLARTSLPESILLRTLNTLEVDPRALAVTSIAGIVAAATAGLLPAWLGTQADGRESLRVHEGGTESRGARAFGRLLLVAEVALACTLLAGSTLLVRSFVNLATADRGFDSSGLISAWVGAPVAIAIDPATSDPIRRSVEDQVAGLPGIQEVGWSIGGVPGGLALSGPWTPDVPGAAAVPLSVELRNVTPTFFDLFRIPIVSGRTFAPGDSHGDVILGERMAAALWPGVNPVGRTFSDDKTRYRVIGVARETHFPSLDSDRDLPEFYTSSGAATFATLTIRCGDRCPDTALIQQRIDAAHPGVKSRLVVTLDDAYAAALATPRTAATLSLVFAVIALLAAAGGLFSVLSYAVSRRRREFGIRTALGASAAHIRQAVFRDALIVMAAGLGVGSVLALLLARTLSSLQYGATASDPVSLAIVAGTIALTTLLAAWRPARAAARVDPVQLLREE